LDSGATALKPVSVVEAMNLYYKEFPANVHRGGYPWANRATEEYEKARKEVASFIGAEPEEIIFTKNATEGLNLAAHILSSRIFKGDRIVVSILEHHANFLPWMRLARLKEAEFVVVKVTPEGRLDMDDLKVKLTPNTKIVALSMASNVLGTITPFGEISKWARDVGAVVVLDGAQYVPHHPLNVRKTGAHFVSFSGHKMFGPMGTGVLWGKRAILEDGEPLLMGGSMIKEVRVDGYDLASTPTRYEAGTPDVAAFVGLGEAARFIKRLGYDYIGRVEGKLLKYAWDILNSTNGIEVYGPPPKERTALISFNLKNLHPHDLAWYLGEMGIMVRSGGHCAHPLHKFLKIPHGQSVRVSFSVFNTTEDIDKLKKGIEQARKAFGI